MLEDFEAAIVKYGNLIEDIKGLPKSNTFGWITMDLSPAREATSNEAQHWRYMFLEHLEKDMDRKLKDLDVFCHHTTAGLKHPVQSGLFRDMCLV